MEPPLSVNFCLLEPQRDVSRAYMTNVFLHCVRYIVEHCKLGPACVNPFLVLIPDSKSCFRH